MGKKEEAVTLQQLWDKGRTALNQAGIKESDLDARLLLLEAFQLDMAHFLIRRRELLDKRQRQVQEAIDQYEMWIRERAHRIPLQHLTGKQEFMGLEFSVNRHVLIPRQDTETLVELVIKRCPAKNVRVLDLCTGSGCIAVSLAVLGGYEDVTASDISLHALETAYENGLSCLKSAGRKVAQKPSHSDRGEEWKREVSWKIQENGDIFKGKITFLKSDLFQNLDKSGNYDIIVSNPPYIQSKVIESLAPEVKDYEPRLALDGTEDGLYFYRCLAKESGDHLAKCGVVFFEIGFDQGEAVKKLLSENGFQDIEVIKDSAGLDRVVYGKYAG